MARRNKLWRFAQLQSYPNYYEAPVNGPDAGPEVIGHTGEAVDLRGHWSKSHFKNEHPITLELACGRGEYTVALAQEHEARNFIGIDIKGARIYQGATQLLKENYTNAAFLRTRIEVVDRFFALGEIDEIWITFPDPFHNSVNRRLTSPRFWVSYARLLKPGGKVHLKTDDPDLYEYSRSQTASEDLFRLIADVADIYGQPSLPHPELKHRTYYEQKNISKSPSIRWLCWQRTDALPPEPYVIS